MTVVLFLLVLLSETCTVAGQLVMKHAMTLDDAPRARFIRVFSIAIACMAAGFFIWTGLMQFFDLSYLYPFDGLNRLMIVFGASYFLKEKITPALWLGVGLISVGVVLVSAS